MAEQIQSTDLLLGMTPQPLRESPLRRQLTRFDRIQILDEVRVRNRYALCYEQASTITTQVIQWNARADMNKPRTQLSEVFDLASAIMCDGFDNSFHPVPFLANNVSIYDGEKSQPEIDGTFYIPLRFGSRTNCTLSFQYDTLGIHQNLGRCAEYFATIVPTTLQQLTVRIEGLNGMRVQPATEDLALFGLGPVVVEQMDTKEQNIAESKRVLATIQLFADALQYEIPLPLARHMYRFAFRAVRVAAPIRLLPQQAADAFRADLPQLLADCAVDPSIKWAAYHGSERIGVSTSRELLRTLCRQRNIPSQEVRIYGIDAAFLNHPIDTPL